MISMAWGYFSEQLLGYHRLLRYVPWQLISLSIEDLRFSSDLNNVGKQFILNPFPLVKLPTTPIDETTEA